MGRPNSSMKFFLRFYEKTQMNFLTNPIDWRNELEIPEIDWLIDSQLIFNKGVKHLKGNTTDARRTRCSYGNRNVSQSLLHTTHQNNSRWMIDLNRKAKALKILEENMRLSLLFWERLINLILIKSQKALTITLINWT